MNSIILKAARLASALHKGQKRDVTGDPYERHLGRVAARVTVFTAEEYGLDADEELVAAAWLHDSREDTPITYQELLDGFGRRVADTVEGLTNQFTSKAYPKMTRAKRKSAELTRLLAQPLHVRAIKLVDRHDNLREIDPLSDFAKVYAGESSGLIQLGQFGLSRLALELESELASVLQAITISSALRVAVSDKDLVTIVEDVKDRPHPDTWSHCGQREVLSITSELQSLRAADKRVATVLKALGRPDYIPLLQDDGGRAAHHNVVKVVTGAISGDPEFASYWS